MSKETNGSNQSNLPTADERKKAKAVTLIIIISSIVAFFVIVGIFVGITMNREGKTFSEVLGIGNKRIDYINDSLKKYVEIDESDYKNYDIEVDIKKPSDLEVENKIMQILAKNKGKLKYDEYKADVPITPGDVVRLYYVGYIKDENGNRIKEVEGANNLESFKSKRPHSLEIGGGAFILGFELGLIGKTASPVEVAFEGEVLDTDVVYATVTYVEESGLVYDEANVRIDLSDPDVEKKWGEGIKDYIKSKPIGTTNREVKTLTLGDSDEKITYVELTVNYVTADESGAVTVETYFPHNYEEESLRNKKVYFDVFIEDVECYENPEFTDDFVRDTLKLEDKVSSYPGETLTEKCRAYYLQALMDEYQKDRKELAETKMWELLKEKIEIKKYPEYEIEKIYSNTVLNYEIAYDKENSYLGYESFDEYMTTLLNLSVGEDWEMIVEKSIREEVKENLIFYSILKKENLVLGEEDFQKKYKERLMVDYEDETGKTKDSFAGEEAYEAALKAYRDRIVGYYGESYYNHRVYYYYATDILLSYANVVDKVQ